MPNKGLLVVVSGPSGAGKGTVLHRYFALDPDAYFSVSATTRAPRPGEVDGVDYHFVSREAFEKLLAEGGVLEHTVYNGNYYGTLRGKVLEKLDEGRNVLLDIEVDGASQVRRLMPDALLIFLAPPSFGELERRLRGRGTESEAQISARLARARVEMREAPRYDRVLVNDDADRAAAELREIVEAARRAPAENEV